MSKLMFWNRRWLGLTVSCGFLLFLALIFQFQLDSPWQVQSLDKYRALQEDKGNELPAQQENANKDTNADSAATPVVVGPASSAASVATSQSGSLVDLTSQRSRELNGQTVHRYESTDTWRDIPESNGELTSKNAIRLPVDQSGHQYKSKGDYMRQPIVADYDESEAANIMLMIKTGATVLWQRLPVHMFTTLTRVKNFALYSDAPGSIAGHEIIDILAGLTEDTHNHDAFEAWRRQKILHDTHSNSEYNEVPSKTDSGIARNTGWHLDKYKNIPMLHHAWNAHPDLDFYVYIDADTFIFIDSLVRVLKDHNPDEHLYMGNLRRYHTHLHDKTISFAQGGSGVVLSRKTMQAIGEHPEWVSKYENITHDERGGDDMVAIMLQDELGVETLHNAGFHEELMRNTNFRPESWCIPIITFHHCTARDVEVLWEYEKLKRIENKPIYHSDIYKDFVLPYIDWEVKDWDSFIAGPRIEYKQDKENKDESKRVIPAFEGGPEIRPYETVAACKKWCDDDAKCLAWHHRSGDNPQCTKSENFKIGKSTYDWQTSSRENEKHTSGWMIDRIRSMRSASGCDVPDENIIEGYALALVR